MIETYGSSRRIIEMIAFSESLVELTPRSELKDQINPSLIIEIAVKSKNVWVSEMCLDFDLTSELVLNIVFDEL